MLLRVAENYEKRLKNSVKRLISLLEPAMILVMGRYRRLYCHIDADGDLQHERSTFLIRIRSVDGTEFF